MPIYEYQCQVCGHQLESLQKVSDEPLRHCPACGKDSLVKMISASNFHLKGGGWFKSSPTEKSAISKDSAQASKKETDTATPATKSAKTTGKEGSASTSKKDD